MDAPIADFLYLLLALASVAGLIALATVLERASGLGTVTGTPAAPGDSATAAAAPSTPGAHGNSAGMRDEESRA